MIHEIEPYSYDNSYLTKVPNEKSVILIFKQEGILVNKEKWDKGEVDYLLYSQLESFDMQYQYLFCISNIDYFLGYFEQNNYDILQSQFSLECVPIDELKGAAPKHQVFAGITGNQLFHWYLENIFCGHCGFKLVHGKIERRLDCLKCGNVAYPRISPGVIVGILDGDKILLTKYAQRAYKKYALVAGFNEIGESLEETVKREVLEEVGLKVKNIRYYKSQPWANSGTLLCGYYADLDGESDITLEEAELSEAVWFSRSEIQIVNEDFSLTNEMIVNFKKGYI